MKLVNSIEEIQELSPYRKNYNVQIKDLEFPCLARFELGGGYYTLEIVNIPKEFDLESFIAGRNSKSKTYSEAIFKKKNNA
jgi:hypothetical protein